MKNVKLKNMKLRNFKGIAALDINFNLVDTNIYGKNATGKTTLVDAFMWLFFNKDSNGTTDFDIKTKTADGNYIHNLEHTVEAIVDVDGTETKFMKLYKEKYTKQRGSTKATFTGHTTDFFVDDVPKKKKEYEEIVNRIFDNKYFQIITDPFYFNEKMKWQDRRKLLIDICGDVSDRLVIDSNADLEPLMDVIAIKSIDDYRLQLKSQMKPINDELKALPIKINEAHLAIPTDIETIDEEKLAFINNRIQELENKKASALSGGAIAEKETELIKLKNNKLLLENEVPNNKKLKDEYYSLSLQADSIKREIACAESAIENKKFQQKQNEEKRDELRSRYVEINGMQYDESKNICPHCNQPLPADQIVDFMEKFNIKKSNDLEVIGSQGKYLKEEFDKRADEITILSNDIELKKREINDLDVSIQSKKQEINNIQNAFAAEQQPKIEKINEQILNAMQEIASLKGGVQTVVDEIEAEINSLKEQRSEIDAIKAKANLAEVQKKRIADLEAREKELAKEYSDKDQALYLTDLFIKTKVNMLTERINSYFKLCNFKLFNIQINGGLEECCIPTFNGVEYSDLNTASKINVGLDCINTVSQFINCCFPVFLDNAECINEPLETQSQLISLFVTEHDERLRVENR